MVRDLVLQPVTQEPEVIHSLRHDLHQFPLTGHIIEKKQEHQLQDHFGIDRDVPLLPITMRDLGSDKAKVQNLRHSAQRMIAAHPLLQVDRVAEERSFRLLFSHHLGKTLLPDRPSFGYYYFPAKLLWATRPQEPTPKSYRGVCAPCTRETDFQLGQVSRPLKGWNLEP